MNSGLIYSMFVFWLSMAFSGVLSKLKFKSANNIPNLLVQSATFASIQNHRKYHVLHDSDFCRYCINLFWHLNIFSKVFIAALISGSLKHISCLLVLLLLIVYPKMQKLSTILISVLRLFVVPVIICLLHIFL